MLFVFLVTFKKNFMKYLLTTLLLFPCILYAQDYGKLHFDEQFNDNSNKWSEYDDEERTVKVNKGHYLIDHKDKDKSRYFFLNIPEIDFQTENFVIEARLKQTDGLETQGYGMRFCIYNDYSNYRNLFVSSNGYYKISHFYSNEDHKTLDWTLDKTIVKSKGEYNLLRVEREANIMRFYINDKMVGFNTMNRYFTNRIGFFISGVNTIEVDYLKVWTSPLIINYVPDPLENAQPENLGSMINTEATEKAPVISPDGKTLFFSRNLNESIEGQVNTDIFYSVLDERGEWVKSVSIGQPLNNDGPNSITMVLPDNNTLMLMNKYKNDGSSGGGGLSLTKRTVEGWELPKNIKITDYHNRSKFAGYALSPSGKVLILAAQRDETTGGRDLYVSFRENDSTWSKPLGMGTVINTLGDEDSPFIAADDKTLYFSSEGHPGLGGADVFLTRRLDDTWTNWSKPQNLGKSINSFESEYGFNIAADGVYAYLYKQSKKDVDGFGKSDIFRIQLSESSKPDPIVFIEGQVFDSETKLPLAASITYEDLYSKSELGIANSEPKNGKYQIALPFGKVYGFLANKENYYAVGESIDLTNVSDLKTIKKDLYLTPIRKGVNIRLNNIFFEYDKADLKQTSFVELDRLVRLLKDNPSWSIEIGGHTDDSGSDSYNKTLSQKRASSVRDYLISKGISANRLMAKGYGEEQPIGDNTTESGKAQNRRVEFRIL
jgi:OmpA-OmpF porin, OOP family